MAKVNLCSLFLQSSAQSPARRELLRELDALVESADETKEQGTQPQQAAQSSMPDIFVELASGSGGKLSEAKIEACREQINY